MVCSSARRPTATNGSSTCHHGTPSRLWGTVEPQHSQVCVPGSYSWSKNTRMPWFFALCPPGDAWAVPILKPCMQLVKTPPPKSVTRCHPKGACMPLHKTRQVKANWSSEILPHLRQESPLQDVVSAHYIVKLTSILFQQLEKQKCTLGLQPAASKLQELFIVHTWVCKNCTA